MTELETSPNLAMLDAQGLLLLASYCNRWIASRDTSAIPLILNHPLAKLCTSDKGVVDDVIYKLIPVTSKSFLDKGKIDIVTSHNVLIFSNFANEINETKTFENTEKAYCVFKHKFKREDLLLNFTQLLDELRKMGYRIHVVPQGQTFFWMQVSTISFTKENLIGIHE